MAARIDKIIDAPGKPGRKIIEGEPLPEDHPVYEAYVGQPTPSPPRTVRASVTRSPISIRPWAAGHAAVVAVRRSSRASSYAATSRPRCTSASPRSAPFPNSCAGLTPFELAPNRHLAQLPPPR
jgi:hypothetical protein